MKRPKHRVLTIEKLRSVIKQVFEQYVEIQLAYLYGSYALGIQDEYSDIDVGVVLKREFNEPPLYFAELSSKIDKIFNYKIEIDLRILNKCTPRFLFQVIKNCKILYCKNNTFKDEYEVKIINQYLDIKPMLDMFDMISIKEVLGDEY